MDDESGTAGKFPEGSSITIFPPQLPLDFTLPALDRPIVRSIIAGAVERQDMIMLRSLIGN